MNDIVPKTILARRGVAAVAGISAGVALLLVSSLPIGFGIVAGAVALIAGLVHIKSDNPTDRRGGSIALVAGGAVIGLKILSLIPVLKTLAGVGIGLAAVGLIALGVVNAWQFRKGLKSRT